DPRSHPSPRRLGSARDPRHRRHRSRPPGPPDRALPDGDEERARSQHGMNPAPRATTAPLERREILFLGAAFLGSRLLYLGAGICFDVAPLVFSSPLANPAPLGSQPTR